MAVEIERNQFLTTSLLSLLPFLLLLSFYPLLMPVSLSFPYSWKDKMAERKNDREKIKKSIETSEILKQEKY